MSYPNPQPVGRWFRGVVLAALAGCAAEPAAPVVGDPRVPEAPAPSEACPVGQWASGGRCCPMGEVATGSGECVAVGPRGCEDAMVDHAATCLPRWCPTPVEPPPVDGWDPDDPRPHEAWGGLCALDADSGGAALSPALECPAGSYLPMGGAVECVRAGALLDSAEWSEGIPADEPLGATSLPAGVPTGDSPPGLDAPMFCAGLAAGEVRICDPGEEGCGAGWMPGPPEGPACVPFGVSWECPPGFVPDQQATRDADAPSRCVPDPADCISLEEARRRHPGARVVGAASSAGEGAAERDPTVHFDDLASALAASAAGDVIVVGPGEHHATLEIGISIEVRGVCAHEVALIGPVGGALLTATGAGSTPARVVLSGLTLRPQSVAIRVADHAVVELDRVVVRGAEDTALRVVGPSSSRLEARDCVFGAALSGPPPPQGTFPGASALHVEGGTEAELERVLVTGWRGHAIQVHEMASLKARELSVRDTAFSSVAGVAQRGWAIRNSGGVVSLSSATLLDNAGGGIDTRDGGRSSLRGVAVLDRDAASWSGLPVLRRGVAAHFEGGVEAWGVFVQGGFAAGLYARGQALGAGPGDTSLRAQGAIVAVADEVAVPVATQSGILIRDVASIELDSAWIDGLVGTGVLVGGPGATARVADTRIEGIRRSGSPPQTGSGLQAESGGRLDADRVALVRCDLAGISVTLDATAAAQHLLIEGCGAAAHVASSLAAGGAIVGPGSTLEMQDAVLDQNVQVGAAAGGPGSRLILEAAVVRRTNPREADGSMGTGLLAYQGGHITARRVHVSESHAFGISAEDPGTMASLDRVLVTDTGAPSAEHHATHAVAVRGGASLRGDRVRVRRSAGTGIVAGGLLPATLALTRFEVSDVTGTAYAPHPSAAVIGADGSRLLLQEGGIQRVTGMGIALGGPGTTLDALGIWVDDTRALSGPEGGAGGLALSIIEQADAQLVGSRLTRGVTAGVGVLAAHARLLGTEVSDMEPSSEGLLGVGAGVMAAPSLLEVHASSLHHNTTAGIRAELARVRVLQSSVQQVRSAEEPPGGAIAELFADGIDATACDELSVSRSLIADCDGVGLRLESATVATLDRSTVTRNTFGIATLVGAVTGWAPTLAESDSAIVANTAEERIGGIGVRVESLLDLLDVHWLHPAID